MLVLVLELKVRCTKRPSRKGLASQEGSWSGFVVVVDVIVVLVLVLVLKARCTRRPSKRPCKSRRCFLLCRCCCCYRNCGGVNGRGRVGVGVSPEGTLDKETFKKALQVKKVRGPALSLLLVVVVV